jgi:prophage DNA circulation protein
MATWSDQLGKVELDDGRKLIAATFRGVPFFVDTSERGGGRRTVVHEYPLRDDPFIEDMGRRARFFQVDGYVLGDGYVQQRDKLIAALEQALPGELAHPYYGYLYVLPSAFRVRESTADGGLARFSIDFEETSAEAPAPVATVAAPAAVSASVDAAQAAVSADFQVAYSVDGEPAYSLESLAAVVASAGAALDAALAPVVLATQDLAVLKRDLDELVLDADALVRQPLLITSRFAAALVALTQLPLTPRLGIRALMDAYGFTPSAARPATTTATRVLERLNYDALLHLVRVVMLSQAARLAAQEAFATYDEALLARDAIADALDVEAETAGDETFAALAQLRADLVRAVPGEASDLPRLVTYTPPATVPSLVLAQQLYGDVSLEADLVTRNRVERPGFVAGGVALEVLARA